MSAGPQAEFDCSASCPSSTRPAGTSAIASSSWRIARTTCSCVRCCFVSGRSSSAYRRVASSSSTSASVLERGRIGLQSFEDGLLLSGLRTVALNMDISLFTGSWRRRVMVAVTADLAQHQAQHGRAAAQ